MNDNEFANSACGFDGDLPGYFYGEIEAAQKSRVEKHLAICGECSSELANASTAMVSVHEWKVVEFANLPLTHFSIDTSQRESEIPQPWWAAILQLRWPLPALAGAVAILIGGFALLVGYPALNPVDISSVHPPVAKENVSQTAPAPFPGERASSTAAQTTRSEPREELEVNPKRDLTRPTMASAQPGSKIYNAKPVVRKRVALPPDKSVANRVPPSPPEVSAFDESEDQTLRLGEIFSEIDES